jgi:hypothetical protein
VLNANNTTADRSTVMGNKCMNITDKVDFKRKIWQNIMSTVCVPLNDGTYRMTCQVKSASKFNRLEMYAVSGIDTFKVNMPYSDGQWHHIVIDNISISGGVVEVGFYADGAAGDWARVDDATLVKMSDAIPASVRLSSLADHTQESYYTLDGIRLLKPRKGLNIIRRNTNGKLEIRKVIIR